MGKWQEDAKQYTEDYHAAMAQMNNLRDAITAETLAKALADMEKDPLAQPPAIKVEIAHPGIDRKNSSPRSEAAFREAIRRALVIAKVSALPPGYSAWPNGWNETNGGQRVTKAEIRIVAYNSRSFGSQSESVIRYELSGRFGLYDERGSGEIVDAGKKRDDGDPRIVVSVKALDIEFVKSWAERVEAGEIGSEPDKSVLGICICGHVGALAHGGTIYANGPCNNCECPEFVRDPSISSPFVAGGFNDPAAQIKAPAEEAPRVQGIRDEDPSPEDVEDDDLRMAILARMMRGDVTVAGGGGAKGRMRRDRRVQRDLDAKYDRLLQDDGTRPLMGSGRISQEAHDALYAQEESVGEMLDYLGRKMALCGANGFGFMREVLDAIIPDPAPSENGNGRAA